MADEYEQDRQYDEYMRERDDRRSSESIIEFFVLGGIGFAVVGGLIFAGAGWVDQHLGTHLTAGLSDWFHSITSPPAK